MKILVALHQCMDLGGIINHTEQLIGGLKDLGHDVTFKELVWSTRANGTGKKGDWITGPSGIPHDQGKGWKFDSRDRIAYRGPALTGAIQQLEEFELIIWTVPVPSKNKNNVGNSDWVPLYEDLPKNVKQMAFVHDGNARKGSSHIMAIEQHLSGIACVHPCALGGTSFTTTPRALVVNPQHDPIRSYPAWDIKQRGFVNMQTFKAWKHAHELVEAIAYMPKKGDAEFREIAGLGIEYRYMTSEDKCKPQYFHSSDTEEWFQGWKFWEAAEANGLTHHGYWNSDEVEAWLNAGRVLVDPSWSNNYSKIGGHFNRVVVDAMIRGMVPVARSLGMGDEVFKAGEHYVEIPQDADAQEYADTILEASNMGIKQADRYILAAQELLPQFDRKAVAQRLIDLAHGEIETQTGTEDPALRSKVEDQLFDHFGVLI